MCSASGARKKQKTHFDAYVGRTAITRSRFSGTALHGCCSVRRLRATERYEAAHPGNAGSGAVSVLGFWPGTRRTMMEVFFWMSSLSSFHSAAPCQKQTARAGQARWDDRRVRARFIGQPARGAAGAWREPRPDSASLSISSAAWSRLRPFFSTIERLSSATLMYIPSKMTVSVTVALQRRSRREPSQRATYRLRASASRTF